LMGIEPLAAQGNERLAFEACAGVRGDASHRRRAALLEPSRGGGKDFFHGEFGGIFRDGSRHQLVASWFRVRAACCRRRRKARRASTRSSKSMIRSARI